MTKPPILLTIILPMLDAEEDVAHSFAHLKRQTGIEKDRIEIVIVDDGSKDATQKMIKKHRKDLADYRDVRIIIHPSRQGLTKTRLDGVNDAKGKFITFIDKKGRPDPDYLASFFAKKRNIVVGNPYIKKDRSVWGRVLVLIRKKLYYPYFNHPFEDVELDHDAYMAFKNKGGGGCTFVLKEYYLRVTKSLPKGVHVSDDTLVMSELAKIEPILKTADPKLEYINRVGFTENIIHLFNRGPKFVDFYGKPGRRFFPAIVTLGVLPVVIVALALLAPIYLIVALGAGVIVLLLISIYLSEDLLDFLICVALLPIATVTFSVGVLKGIGLKLLGRY